MSEFWTIRAGKNGERVDWAIANGVAGGGWSEFSDLTEFRDNKDSLQALVREVLGGSPSRVGNYTGQLWSFIHRIKKGDFMVLPIRSTSQIAIGEVTNEYHYVADEPDPSKRHRLGVNWLKTDISKTLVKQDLLYQMGSAMTVFVIANNDANFRLKQLLAGQSDPGARGAQPGTKVSTAAVDEAEAEVEAEPLNLEELAHDEIARRLQEDFKGHDLSLLVTALLEAEGFTCRNSPPGSDGGVDVLAGMGPLGMDSPKLVVQVKSQTGAVSDVVLQQLNGAIHRYHADQALLVTFGGVTGPARTYLESQYFGIRVWTLSDILAALYKHYGSIPEDIKARLPLKQIWVPAVAEGDG